MVSSEQRRKQLARDKYLRQQQRRTEARRKARVRNVLIAAGVALVLAASAAYATSGGLGGDKEETAADSQPTPAPEPEEAPDPCDEPAKGKPNGEQWKKEPKQTVDESATYTMSLETSCGAIDVKMDASKAPHTVNSFAFLAENDYFDHTPCHRLTTEGIHVLQCGDPTGKGTGGPGYTIPDENLDDPRVKDGVYPAGTVAMANTGQKDSGGSQFFLVHRDSELPPNYTPFGTVSDSGMKVLKKIAKAGVDGAAADGAPVATMVIDEATVTKS